MPVKNQTKIKEQLSTLIISADYLNNAQKSDWLNTIENLKEADLKKLYDEFINLDKEENDNKLEIIFKRGLGDKYKSKIKEISDNCLKVARKKSEAFAVQTEEKPDDILSKLNDL